jgi:glutaredoxin
MIATVWTQPNCPHCDRVKKYLTDAGFQYVERDITAGSEFMREQFKAQYKTTPQVFFGQQLIGTADQTFTYLTEKGLLK